MPGNHEPSGEEWAHLGHYMQHLRWAKGLGVLPESEYVAECWSGTPPHWAVKRADAGEPASRWCPTLGAVESDPERP